MVIQILFIADVTEYIPEQGKDYTTKKRVILKIHNDQQTVWLDRVENCEDEDK